MRGAKNGAPIK